MKIKNIVKKFKDMPLAQKVKVVFAAVTTLSLMIAMPIYAWFARQNEIAMLTKVNSPANLYINAATQQEDIINLSLSSINTEEAGENYEEFVFCVSGKNVSQYDLQIAHTTNIAFTYEIYPAAELSGTDYTAQKGNIVKYTSEDKTKTIFYTYAGGKIDGDYLNRDNTVTNRNVASNDYNSTEKDNHQNYDTTSDDPQVFAKALYWKNKDPISVNTSDDNIKRNGFEHPYILKVSWSQNGQGTVADDDITYVHNNKETDLIYITAAVHE